MISKEEVKHIAKLARLGLTEKETEKFQKELSSILDYFEKLKKLDVSGITPTSQSVFVENIMREDGAEDTRPEVINGMMEQAPETKDGYLKVKSIIKLPFTEAQIWN